MWHQAPIRLIACSVMEMLRNPPSYKTRPRGAQQPYRAELFRRSLRRCTVMRVFCANLRIVMSSAPAPPTPPSRHCRISSK
jgi:hypothetical protein